MELAELAAPPAGLVVTHLLRQAELVASNAEAVRMIEQGAVRIDGQRITSRDLVFSANADLVVQVGKRRFKRVRLLPAG
jgi:tyrosyl-tRNA synthetase